MNDDIQAFLMQYRVFGNLIFTSLKTSVKP